MTAQLTRDSWRMWEPPPKVPTRDWVSDYVIIPEETETPGPFDLRMFPHASEILDECDKTHVREIYLPHGSRLGKTTLCMSILIKKAASEPRPSLVVRESREMSRGLIETQLTPMFDACPQTKRLMPPEHRRNPSRGIRLPDCFIRAAWSASPGSLGGFPAAYGLASEISKWSKNESTESDPVYLFRRRAGGFNHVSLLFFESTPGLKNRCNITDLCNQPGVDVRRRLCPCPHCGEWQEIVFDVENPRNDGPGLKWDFGGDLAAVKKSAYYECVGGCRIESIDRPEMLRRGRWVSEGQTINTAGELEGEAVNPNAERVAFGHPERHPFGFLYSLMVEGWAALAVEWINAEGKRESRREFINQGLGQTYDPTPPRVHPDELEDRLAVDIPLRVVPEWSEFLTLGSDAGRPGDEFEFPLALCAWGAGGRGHLVDYGFEYEVANLRKMVRGVDLVDRHENADKVVPLVASGIDSGDNSVAVYQLCRSLPNCWPLKGSSGNDRDDFESSDFGPDLFRGGYQRAGVPNHVLKRKKLRQEFDLLIVNTNGTQQWLEDRVTGYTKRSDEDWFSIPREALIGTPRIGVDLPKHLLGDYQTERGTWRKRWEEQHIRDAIRYARVLAELFTQGGTRWQGPKPKPKSQPKQTPQETPRANPRAWLITDR